MESQSAKVTGQSRAGAKTARGQRRPAYVANPEVSRDPPSITELDAMRGRSGAKLWRRAREGKL